MSLNCFIISLILQQREYYLLHNFIKNSVSTNRNNLALNHLLLNSFLSSSLRICDNNIWEKNDMYFVFKYINIYYYSETRYVEVNYAICSSFKWILLFAIKKSIISNNVQWIPSKRNKLWNCMWIFHLLFSYLRSKAHVC